MTDTPALAACTGARRGAHKLAIVVTENGENACLACLRCGAIRRFRVTEVLDERSADEIVRWMRGVS